MDENQANLQIQKLFEFHQQGDFANVLKIALQLQKHFPKFALAYKAAGVALNALNRKAEAVLQMKKAVKLDPNDDETLSNLGQIFIEIAKNPLEFNNAKNILKEALQKNPKNFVALNNLAAAYSNLGDFVNAKIYAENAIKIAPNYGIAHHTLAVIFAKTHQMLKAVEHSKLATEFSPEFVPAWVNLIQYTLDIGEAEKAAEIADIAQKVKSNANNFEIHAARMRNDNYRQNVTAEMIAENIKKFQQFLVEKFRRNGSKMQIFNFEKYKKINDKNLKIGFVSGDFRDHAVAKFLLNLFPQFHSRENSQIEIFAYANCPPGQEDEVSKKLKKYFAKYRNIHALSDLETAKIIHKDKIQILFDLSGHTDKNRLEMFALKPAPIQISWIGWLGTTGIPTMDYFLADEFCVPFGEKYEKQFSEKVLRMPHIWEVLTPPDFPREIQKNFCESRGNENENFIFASFNNPNKVNSKTLDIWCEVLRKSPENTEFIWYRGDFVEKDLQEKFLTEFAKRGVGLAKIKIMPTYTSEEYFEKLQSVDLILDTITATGMTTTAEALSVGTPTLTCVGDCIQNRFSGTCINAIGDENLSKNFIFDNENDFVNQAVFFAENPEKLDELKINLVEKARKSPLCDAELFAKNFEIKMWEVWNKFLKE